MRRPSIASRSHRAGAQEGIHQRHPLRESRSPAQRHRPEQALRLILRLADGEDAALTSLKTGRSGRPHDRQFLQYQSITEEVFNT